MDEERLSEAERVFQDVYMRLRRMGFSPDDAQTLAGVRDVAHAAQKLLDRGCPLHLVVRILWP